MSRIPSRNRLLGNGGRIVTPGDPMPRVAGAGAPASVGLPGAPYGVGPLASQMLAGPFPAASLSVPQTADLTFLDQPFLPTVRQYLPVSRGEAEGPNGGAGGRLLAPSPTIHPIFWNVTVWGREMVRGPDDTPFTKAQIVGNGCQASYYKIRVQWNEYPSRRREILLDAGTAFDIAVGPTTNLFVDLMAPDPESSDPRPPGFDGFRVDAYVVASAWGASVPIGHATGRFTQAVYMPDIAPPADTLCVRIADGARLLQVQQTALGQPSAAVWSVRDEDGSTIRPMGNVAFGADAADRGTGIVDIPQYAKAICFETTEPDILFNTVQELEL